MGANCIWSDGKFGSSRFIDTYPRQLTNPFLRMCVGIAVAPDDQQLPPMLSFKKDPAMSELGHTTLHLQLLNLPIRLLPHVRLAVLMEQLARYIVRIHPLSMKVLQACLHCRIPRIRVRPW